MKFQWIFWPLAGFCLAVVLFQVKQSARGIEREITRTHANIEATEQSIEVLKAEWSHLNQPGYLKSLATRHLDYDASLKTDVIKLDDLPMRKHRARALGRSTSPDNRPAPQPPAPQTAGSFRHVTDIDLIGSMIRNDTQSAGQQ